MELIIQRRHSAPHPDKLLLLFLLFAFRVRAPKASKKLLLLWRKVIELQVDLCNIFQLLEQFHRIYQVVVDLRKITQDNPGDGIKLGRFHRMPAFSDHQRVVHLKQGEKLGKRIGQIQSCR